MIVVFTFVLNFADGQRMNCLLFGLVCVCSMMLVSSERNTYRFTLIPTQGVEIVQDILHDTVENTVTVVVGDVSMYKGYEASVNYHDFNMGYVVFKHIRRQVCLLSVAPIPYATPALYAKGSSNHTLDFHFSVDPAQLSHEDVINIAGERLANFCRHYRTYLQTLTPRRKGGKDISTLARVGCSQVCFFCLVAGNSVDIEML